MSATRRVTVAELLVYSVAYHLDRVNHRTGRAYTIAHAVNVPADDAAEAAAVVRAAHPSAYDVRVVGQAETDDEAMPDYDADQCGMPDYVPAGWESVETDHDDL